MVEIKRTNVLDKGFVELVEAMGNDRTVCQAARVSTLKESKGDESDKKLIHYLMKNKHDSPFEQVEFRFRIKCPLFVRSQIMRHRVFSYNETSRRYTSEEIDFFIPTELRLQDNQENLQGSSDGKIESIAITTDDNIILIPVADYFRSICDTMQGEYEGLINQGVARELARMILPQNLYTKFYMKGNLRNFLHFIELRDSEHAQPEIRVYAKAMSDMIREVAPWSFEAWEQYRRD